MFERAVRWRALVLLAAALGQPAWALGHVALHAHLADEHPHAGLPSSPLWLADAVTCDAHGHHHDHEHPTDLFVRPTRGTEVAAPLALLASGPIARIAAGVSWRLPVATEAPRSGPRPRGPAAPRAPPGA